MNYEEEVEMSGFGLASVKGQGDATPYDSESQQSVTRYSHVAFGLGFQITREEMDDNLYEKKGVTRTQALAFSFRQTKENVAANVYNRAFNTSYTGGDGKALLVTDHPSLSGSQSNTLATAADISEAALEDICVQIMNVDELAWPQDRPDAEEAHRSDGPGLRSGAHPQVGPAVGHRE
jgi:hypothetical protein